MTSSLPAFTIGTLVTRPDMYAAMTASFEAKGFAGDIEWIEIDNSGTDQTDAYAGLNRVLAAARGRYVILCHQDILLEFDDRAVLEQRLAELTTCDPRWAIAANAGGAGARHVPRRISDPHGENQSVGPFPHRVDSVDENFMVIRADARLAFSSDIGGFHFYGADICLIADVLGYTAYVIDFHLRHLSGGSTGVDFFDSERRFRAKWQRALRDRDLQTTCAFMRLSGRRRPRMVTATLEEVAQFKGRVRRSWAKRRAR